jgi:hypothetical protein
MSERDLRPAERVSDELLGGLLNRSWKIEQMTSRGPKKNFTFETGLAVHLMLDLQDARAEIATLQRAHDPGCDACDPLTAHVRIAELVDERDEARRLVVGTAMHGSKCAYCGALIKIEDMNNFDGIALLLRRHLAKCPKHPMRAVEAERDRLRAQLERAEEVCVAVCELDDAHTVNCEIGSPTSRETVQREGAAWIHVRTVLAEWEAHSGS